MEKLKHFIKEAVESKDNKLIYELNCQRIADWGLCKLQEKSKKREPETTTIEFLLEDMNSSIFSEDMDKELVERVLTLISLGLKSIFLNGKELKKGDFFLTKKIKIDWYYYDKRFWEKN